MKEEGLQKKVLSGLVWKFGERIGAQAVSFIVSMILARLLLPKDYGVVAMITIFIEIANVFVVSGFGQSLIQKKDADRLDFSSVFYFSVTMSWALYALVFFCAPFVASFYKQPILIPILRVMALKLPLAGVNSVQQAYVQKNMLFKRFFFSTLIGTIGSAVVGIAMAYYGFGAWALVAQYLFNSALDTLVLWVTVKWRPLFQFSLERMKELFSFGWKMLMSELIHTAYQQIRGLVIGKLYTGEDLAYYNQGQRLPNVIVTNINSSIGSVLFPAMTTKQEDKEGLKKMVRLSIQIGSYIMWPLMIGMVVVAEPVVRLIFSDRWLPCVPFLQIACIQYALEPVQTANIQAVKALGKGRTMLIMEIVKKGFGILSLLAVMWQGVMWIAWTGMVVTFFAALVNSTPNRKYLGYTYKEQLADLLPAIFLAAFMGVVVYFAGMLPLGTIPVLGIQVITGIVVYLLFSHILKIKAFVYVKHILTDNLAKIKK
ncbi:MAG: lipopolysaccharide biosynthesis protein [Lachnospiraceae bacterium]|nr:lipopolysaccharide biosynthesis protein [Lachnospiraceae bacterium]